MDRNYVSSFEQFLNLYKAQQSKTDDDQREGRALLWDKIPMTAPTPACRRRAKTFLEPRLSGGQSRHMRFGDHWQQTELKRGKRLGRIQM
ncbi:DUF3460 family protein [Caballeronia sp. LZ003]|uniref:DUF3460 family protein n=1 Tax=Caballeronia sp. LZ003 TaxID=3038559 RepID=UPI00285622A6|nr:DUF3460 family protein [Caballeronia sp. LZ003]MDR5853129.1 DUF3460 family protein [Caballeronia sp. LZ003]